MATPDTSPGANGRREPASSRRRRATDLAINVTLLASAFLAYSAVRTLTADDFTTAMANAAELMSFQRLVGLPSELDFQRQLLSRTILLKAANVYYVGLHFPGAVAFLGWVWLRHRQRFDRVRNALVGATIVGLVAHIAYPLAPPRMIPGFVDTAKLLGPNPWELEIAASSNQIAAMPSLHVGWALLIAIGIISIVVSPWRFLALIHPAITTGVVIVTANHYWLDSVVGAFLVITAWMVAGVYPRRTAADRSNPVPHPGPQTTASVEARRSEPALASPPSEEVPV